MRAVIALGSNLGNPSANLDIAIALLRESTDVIAVSTFYKTAPVGGPTQPDFINAVCVIESELPAIELLSLLHGIEKSLGRQRLEHWGPRTLDLDLIQYGDLVSENVDVQLPHPRAHERRFVLEPWHEIDADAILLNHGRIDEILAQLPTNP